MPRRAVLLPLQVSCLEDRLAPAAAGDLDPSFGIGGVVTFESAASQIAVRPDGRIVIADFHEAVQFDADGSPDQTFGTDGFASLLPSDIFPDAVANSVVVLPDGGVLVVGQTIFTGTPEHPDVLVVRFTPDGHLDASFGLEGRVTLPFGDQGPFQDDIGYAAAVQPDGKIVVVGTTRLPLLFGSPIGRDAMGPGSMAAARLTPDGLLDPTFGVNGLVSVSIPFEPYNDALARAVAIQPDGGILLAGSAITNSYYGVKEVPEQGRGEFIRKFAGDTAIIRLTADGQIDTTFGDEGRVRIPFNEFVGIDENDDDSATAIRLLSDGRIAVAGYAEGANGPLGIALRLTNDGALDPTFDQNGKAEVVTGGRAATIAPDGRVTFAGELLARLNDDGSPDPSFDEDGRVVAPFASTELAANLAVDAFGNVLLPLNGKVVRVLGDESPLPAIAVSGSVLVGGKPDGTARLFTPTGDPLRASDSVTFFPGSNAEVRVATADVNGDGVLDLIGGTGPGVEPAVVVLDGVTREVLARMSPFEQSFTGGLFVEAGDVTGDGIADLIVTPDQGGGPRVRIFSGDGFAPVADFFGIDDVNFRGGARSAVGDFDGDGSADLVVAAGFGGGPRVAAFSGKSLGGKPVKLFADFLAFEPELRNGSFVTAGDVTGDGKADLIAGGGPGGAPRVTVFDGADLLENVQTRTADFFAGDPEDRGGVRLTSTDLDGDENADLITGAGTGSGVVGYSGATLVDDIDTTEPFEFDAIPGHAGGVFVG